jgi:hypothetical protein
VRPDVEGVGTDVGLVDDVDAGLRHVQRRRRVRDVR